MGRANVVEEQLLVGKRVSEIAKELSIEPFEAARKLLLDEKLNVNILVHTGHDDNVAEFVLS